MHTIYVSHVSHTLFNKSYIVFIRFCVLNKYYTSPKSQMFPTVLSKLIFEKIQIPSMWKQKPFGVCEPKFIKCLLLGKSAVLEIEKIYLLAEKGEKNIRSCISEQENKYITVHKYILALVSRCFSLLLLSHFNAVLWIQQIVKVIWY